MQLREGQQSRYASQVICFPGLWQPPGRPPKPLPKGPGCTGVFAGAPEGKRSVSHREAQVTWSLR